MNAIDFCFWLQGFYEISGKTILTPEQSEIVQQHLNLVFKHEIDPLRESQTKTPASQLNQAHHGSGNDTLVRC